MAWGKLDDQLYKDKTLLRVSVHARWLHMAAVSFCLEAGSDGRLEAAEVRFLAGSQGCRMSHAQELVLAEEWSRDGDMYIIRDFERRYAVTANATRQARWRNAHRNDAGNAPETDGVTLGVTPERYDLSPPHPPSPTPLTPLTPIPDSYIQGPTPPTPPPGESAADVTAAASRTTGPEQVVFEAWRESVGAKRAVLTPARRKRIRDRLKEGYPVEDLVAAVCGWSNDPWPERVNHNDLGVLLRDAAHVEKFRDLHQQGPPKPLNGAGDDDWKLHSWALHPERAPGANAQ